MPHLRFGVLLIMIFLGGCATPGYLSGSINSQVFSTPTGKRVFIVVLPESATLRDRQIGDQISYHLIQKGYSLAPSKEEANTAVVYKFSIGQGRTTVSSSTNSSTGEANVSSSTDYPRFFQLTVVDLEASKPTGNPVLIWQGEVYSTGSSTNTSKLAKPFIEELFENFGENTNEKSFHKVVMW